jgi:hypothetical protein
MGLTDHNKIAENLICGGCARKIGRSSNISASTSQNKRDMPATCDAGSYRVHDMPGPYRKGSFVLRRERATGC